MKKVLPTLIGSGLLMAATAFAGDRPSPMLQQPTDEQRAQLALEGATQIVTQHAEIFRVAAFLHACDQHAKADQVLDRKQLVASAERYVQAHQGGYAHGEKTVLSLMVGIAGFEIGSEEQAAQDLAKLGPTGAKSFCAGLAQQAQQPLGGNIASRLKAVDPSTRSVP